MPTVVVTPYERISEALEAKGHPVRNGASRCPAHDDHSPSLTISEGTDGRALLKCHTGCATEAIVAELGLTMADLFPPKSNGSHPESKVVARYPYTDEAGELLYTVERYEPGFDGKGKSFAQVPASGRRGRGAMNGVRLVLYRLPKVLAAAEAEQRVFVVEGEKDVEAIEKAGHVATCNPAGAGKWRKVADGVWSLKGARVVIVADKDDNGLRHARDVASTLTGTALTTTVVEALHGKDATDHLTAGFTVDDFFVIASDLTFDPPVPTMAEWLEGGGAEAEEPSDLSIDLDELLATEEPDYEWQVPGLLERGDRVIFTGPEGGGKSTLLRQIGTQFASGIHPFDGEPFPPLRVLLVDVENSRRQVRRKADELRAAAGDDYQPGGLRFEFRPDGLDLTRAEDVEWLTERIETNAAEVLIIGPLYKMATGDPKDEQTARAVALAIDHMRKELGISVIMEAHTPYAEGARSKRPERPYGASLWSRWPEFGIFLAPEGDLRHWRGPREERTWPAKLTRGQPWPWVTALAGFEAPEWHGPTECMAAVLEVLKGSPGTPYAVSHLQATLKATGNGFRQPTVAEAAERLAMDGEIEARIGPRKSRLYHFEGPM